MKFTNLLDLKTPGLALCLAACLALSACTGVPLRSIPKLMQLGKEVFEANPAEFSVALQVDARMVPPPGTVPHLQIKVTPKEAGAFEVIDKKLPMQLAVSSTAALGLDAPAKDRRWLIYSLPPATQGELKQIQDFMRVMRAGPQPKVSSVSLGVEQESLASKDPALANTRWETWLQTNRRDGFFEVWSGTPAQLQKMAGEKR